MKYPMQIPCYVLGYDMTSKIVLLEHCNTSEPLQIPQSVFPEKDGFILTSQNWKYIDHGNYQHKKNGEFFEINNENFNKTGIIDIKAKDYMHDEYMYGDAKFDRYIWIDDLMGNMQYITLFGFEVNEPDIDPNFKLIEFSYYTKNKLNEKAIELFTEIPFIWDFRMLVPRADLLF